MSDLNFQFNTFEPDMDLSDDISGSLLIPHDKEGPDFSLPENFWFRDYKDFSLVHNQTVTETKNDDWFSQAITSNDKKQVLGKAYKMAMNGSSLLEIEQTIKLSFSDMETRTDSELNRARFILPLVGTIFYVCEPYIHPDEVKKIIAYKKGIKPVLILGCQNCDQCQHKNKLTMKSEFCSKLGLPIWNSKFSEVPPQTVIEQLILSGKITDKQEIRSWVKIRNLFLKTPVKESPRVYANNVPAKKSLPPGALYRKGILALNRMAYESSERAEKEAFDAFRIRIANPLIIKLQECILKNRQNEIPLADLINKTLLPSDERDRCKQIITSIKQDPLLWAGVRIYLPAYRNCEDISRFLHRNRVQIPFGILRPECQKCIENSNSICKKLECKLTSMEEQIPGDSINLAIDKLGSTHGIDCNLTRYCKQLEKSQYLSGIRKLRQIISNGFKPPIYNGPGLQEMPETDGSILSLSDVESWVSRKLNENVSVLKIMETLKKTPGLRNTDQIIQQSIIYNRIIPTDRNDLCLTNYQLHHEVAINRTDRCIYCEEAGRMSCNRFGNNFALDKVSIPDGYNETVRYFKDTQLSVDINPKVNKPQINVGINNPGGNMLVNFNTVSTLDDLSIWQEAAGKEMEVDIDSPFEFESGLDCTVDSSSEGMVLGNELI